MSDKENKSKLIKSDTIRQVIVLPHDPQWHNQFQDESLKISSLLGENCSSIHHIGSTAIPGIYAKPIIDILVAVNDLSAVDIINAEFKALAYTCLGEYGIPGRRYYSKGHPEHSAHIHLFEKNDPAIKRHLGFRDYLINHPNEAQGYSWIKRCLAEQFPMDIDSYVKGKESFIRMIDYRATFPQKDQLEAADGISLEAYNPNWKKLAAAEIKAIQEMAHLPFVKLEHLGSTAVEGLSAKPIIDIFIALESISEAEQWIKPLEALGYLYWDENPDKSHHRYFKGMPPFGIKRTHHVHIMQMGDEFEQKISFRDLLRENPSIRQGYEELKSRLAKEYPEDREAYTDAKAKFITNALSI